MASSGLPAKLASIGLADSRWANMLAGVERFDRWLEDQLLFGFATIEADPYASLEPVAARLTDDQLGGAAAAIRGWIARVGTGPAWVERLGEDFGYWHLLNRMALRHERLTDEQFAGVAFAFGYRLQAAKLDALGMRLADRWTCVGVETGSEEALFYRRTHWRGHGPDAAGTQHIYSYGSPPPASTLRVGDWSETSMFVYPDGLPGRLVLPEGVTVRGKGEAMHYFGSWAEQGAWQASCLRRQPWRRYFPLAVGPVRLKLSREMTGGHEVRISDTVGGTVSVRLSKVEPPTDASQRAWVQLLACVGAEGFVLFGEAGRGQVRAWSYWLDGALQAV